MIVTTIALNYFASLGDADYVYDAKTCPYPDMFNTYFMDDPDDFELFMRITMGSFFPLFLRVLYLLRMFELKEEMRGEIQFYRSIFVFWILPVGKR